MERRRRSALDADRALQLPVIAQSNGIPAGWRRDFPARIIGSPKHLSGDLFFAANPSMAISILTSDQHRSVAVDTRARPEYGDTVNRAIALSAEFNELHREYPLLLRKTAEAPGFVAHAILASRKMKTCSSSATAGPPPSSRRRWPADRSLWATFAPRMATIRRPA